MTDSTSSEAVLSNIKEDGISAIIPRDIRFRRLRVWLRFLRIRVAKFILLPELSRKDAQQLRQQVRKDGELTKGYILMCALSAGIATLGLLQSSTAVVIGAMLISPLMNPIAALGFGFSSLDGQKIRDALRVVAVGAAIGILTGVLLTWLSPIRNATPEILARTQPTLLDLAVALFSGIAGGYATVIGRGGTAIGVAIATALMPPLAVLGYGIGVLQIGFTLGALLLFLTNLAAITFSFAVVARLSGAARPLYKVEWTPRYFAILAATFLGLAIPLSMTLVRLSHEASMRTAAREAIQSPYGKGSARIAQLEVSSPLFDEPKVEALVITSAYVPNAESEAEAYIAEKMDEPVDINLQQVLAADLQSQTRAMVDAAMARTAAGIAADVPPFDKIRAAIGLPTRAIWTNTAERMVFVEPVPAPEWTLADYRAVENQVSEAAGKWTVRIVPPARAQMIVALPGVEGSPENSIPSKLAIWALHNWGMASVTAEVPEDDAGDRMVKQLQDAGLEVARVAVKPPEPEVPKSKRKRNAKPEEAKPITTALIRVYALSPSKAAAQKAAEEKAAAEKAAMEKAKLDAEAKQSAKAGA